MIKSFLMSSVLLGFVTSSFALEQITPNESFISSKGRVVYTDSGSYFSWPGAGIEFEFEGDSIGFEFLERSSYLALDIDVDTSIVIKAEEGIRTQYFGGFGPGKHTAFFRRRSEDTGPGAFVKSIFVGDTTTLAKTTLQDRKLLVIGDSFGVGYGNLSETQSCTGAEIGERTDSQKSYATLLQDSAKTEVSSITYSGLGMVRNYAGNSVGTNASTYFLRDIIGDFNSEHDFSNDSTDLIIIELGTNDFSTTLKAGEQWSDIYDLWNDWATTAHQMIDTLRVLQGKAVPVLLITPMSASNPQRHIIKKVVEEQNKAGYGNVHYMELGSIKFAGCQWHPTVSEHEQWAGEINSVLDSLKLWDSVPLAIDKKVIHDLIVPVSERAEFLKLRTDALFKFTGSVNGAQVKNQNQGSGAFVSEGEIELSY
ncbi:SGNH/GDSL hydrolase family protein [Fibrobacterales bacterium]|nr:SGNH/GDSL hydrolase family protein [Fibrobacterales bacterium]